MTLPDPEAHRMYNNGHRAFLQAFMSRGSMTFEESKPALARVLSLQEGRQIMPNDMTIDDFSNMIHTINSAIHPFDMEISSTYPQTATARTPTDAIYALVNLVSDPQTQLATTHSADEIKFVRRVLDGIFETNNTKQRETMAIRGMDAINLSKSRGNGRDSAIGVNGASETQAAADKGLTKNEAEKVLAKLVKEGWMEKSRGGYYTLSPRGLIELKGWLTETYNEEDEDEEEGPAWQRIKTCNGCKEIITVGQRCANGDCICRMHEFCATSHFNNNRGKKCPLCKTDWGQGNFVGEKAAQGPRMSTSGTTAPNRQTQPNSRRQSVREEPQEVEEEEDEEMEEESE